MEALHVQPLHLMMKPSNALDLIHNHIVLSHSWLGSPPKEKHQYFSSKVYGQLYVLNPRIAYSLHFLHLNPSILTFIGYNLGINLQR